MKQLKWKTLKSLLPIIIMFWALTAFAASYAIPGLYTYYFVDPIPLESVDFEEDIEGLYVSGQIYGIYDWYCEEREDSRITAREYLIDANDVYYMCLLADNDSEMDDANKLTDASYAYLSYEDDGTLLMEAQYAVKGVIKPIPADSLKFLHDYLDWDNLEEDVKAQFLPYYLDVNNLGAIEYDSACIAGILGIIFFMVGLIFLILALTGRYQKSIKKYISASASPDLARERVDYFILNTREINGLRYNRDFICGQQGPTTSFAEMSKLAWVYLHTTVHKRYFITVSKSYSLMLGFTDGTRQAVSVKNEKIAQDHMQQLSLLCPQVVFGYTDDLDRMFRKDLNGFLNLRYHTPQEEQTPCYDVELSSPGPEKIKVIKVIREVTGLGLKEAKDLVDTTPSIVKKGVSKQEAEDIKKQLETLGATVTLK